MSARAQAVEKGAKWLHRGSSPHVTLVELMALGCGVKFVGLELNLAFLPHWTLPYLTLCSSEDRVTPGTAGRPLVFWLQLGLCTFSPHIPLSPQPEVVSAE